ncbi:MAG: molybdopterin oxidoreductase, beta (Fe-S) subunit [Candidatus Scalindua rubra]|uniref:Molybdopterin oxidoreductase, beta (Fe-S) subunit n=1 Tax=Candidatus Scalindua rubra TaxID=1872076 RepID=A0A1E3XEK0_9BACT|nr:MAG: molybdopterin oxidoreductase, beta (Fe-S) subunit [Candidatus Scalindua rubra]
MSEPYAVLVDVSKCTGCRGCQVACKQWNNLPAGHSVQTGTYQNPKGLNPSTWNVVLFNEDFLEKDGEKQVHSFFRLHKCMHCTKPVCLDVCPPKAIYRDDTGAVIIDQNKCNGVGACVEACPWGIPQLDIQASKASKCNFCIDRIKDNKKPACVNTCVGNALTFGTRSTIYAMAEERLKALKPRHPAASIYGTDKDTFFGGLSDIYVLPERPHYYGLEWPSLADADA